MSLSFRNLTGSSSGTYAYDSNGNIVTDPYKGVITEYNVLNRTNKVTITTSSGRYINYTYNSGGQLIKKQQYDGGLIQKTTDYVEGYLYENAALVSIGMPEGRMFNTGAELKPEYFITDQQGNVRLSFQEKLSLNITIVKQENSYYPYGLIMPNSTIATPSQPNRNLYNGGSEWQNDYGDLPDLYQTFYRSYDAALGRFTGIDPMAEKFNSLSPYHYAGNNPIMNNDPLGDDFTQQDWDNAMHALRYSRDGASIGEGGFIRYYTSAKDAQYTAAAAIDRSGGWGYTEYGSFRNFSSAMVYNYGRSFYGDWSNLRYGGNYGDVSGILLKQVNIVKYKPLWLVEEEQKKAGANKALVDDNDNGSIWPHLIGPGLIASGQPWIKKRFVTPGSSPATSVISKILSKLPLKSPVRLYSPVINKSGVRWVGTKVVGRFAARWVPIAGWVMTAYDIWDNREIIGSFIGEMQAENEKHKDDLLWHVH